MVLLNTVPLTMTAKENVNVCPHSFLESEMKFDILKGKQI